MKDSIFDFGVDFKKRKIYLFGEIEEENTTNVIKSLLSFNGISPIELIVSSFGGSLYEMLCVYDTMSIVKYKIHTTAIGKCMSAAPLLVAAGTNGCRSSTVNTIFMIHQLSIEANFSDLDKVDKDVTHYRNLEHNWAILMERHTKKGRKFWKTLFKNKTDTFFTPKEALKYGIIDKIW